MIVLLGCRCRGLSVKRGVAEAGVGLSLQGEGKGSVAVFLAAAHPGLSRGAQNRNNEL